MIAQESVFNYIDTHISVTENDNNTKGLILDRPLLDQLIEASDDIPFLLPVIDGSFLDVELREFCVLSDEYVLIRETSNGRILENNPSNFTSYYIIYQGKSIGTFLCLENTVITTYYYQNRQFEINEIDNHLILFDVNDCLMKKTFSCEVKERTDEIDVQENYPESSFSTPKCLELAVEVDYYTRNTFNSLLSLT